MTSSAHIRRVVFGHDWQDLDEWVRAVNALADFSDDEIEKLVATTAADTAVLPCRP